VGNLVLALILGSTVTGRPVAPAEPLPLTGDVVEVRVEEGQSLRSIGARLGVDARALARANGLRPDERVAPGMELDVPAQHIAPTRHAEGIVVNLPQRMLYLYDEGRLKKSWPIAVGGSRWRTPAGRFEVVEMEEDPSWEVPPSIQAEMRRRGQRVRTRVPPGLLNPLGAYWIGLSVGNIGIHGTSHPGSIYRFATHGCIRMHPDDIDELFGRVEVGMPVEIVYEPVLLTVDDGKVWLEAHPDVYGKVRDAMGRARAAAEGLGVAEKVDWAAVAEGLKQRDGVPRVVGDKHHDFRPATD
jgi:L,D-transpeptidase ErfK/SrfK